MSAYCKIMKIFCSLSQEDCICFITHIYVSDLSQITFVYFASWSIRVFIYMYLSHVTYYHLLKSS